MSKDDHEVYERLARIEEKLEQLDDIEDTVRQLDKDLTRYRGVFGGILIAATAVGTAIKMLGGVVTGWFVP